MSFRKNFACALALILLFLAGGLRAQDFGLAVTNSPSVSVGSALNYSIRVTNTFSFSIPNIFVTNILSTPISFVGGTVTTPVPSILNFVTNVNSTFVFANIDQLDVGEVAQIDFTVRPTAGGSLTNFVTVGAPNRITASTILVTQVVLPGTDLAVGLTNATSVLINDNTTIGLSVTNFGTDAVSGVVVSNTLPASFKLISVSPSNASYTNPPGLFIWNVGTLGGNVSTQLSLTVQATNAGTFNLSARVSGDVTDTNTANNTATNTITVSAFLPSDLVVLVVTQRVSHQTGLLEMLVNVTNRATTDVSALRVAVTNLASGSWLYNAVGTNAGAPYVLYNTNLPGGASVNLTLEFYVLIRAAITNQPFAYAVPAISLTAPTNSATSVTNYALTSGGFLIEFPATIGKTYTILYSDDMTFSNALVAQPSIVAPATRVQWIDNGPPKTVSFPGSGSRFYRVIQSQ